MAWTLSSREGRTSEEVKQRKACILTAHSRPHEERYLRGLDCKQEDQLGGCCHGRGVNIMAGTWVLLKAYNVANAVSETREMRGWI